MDFYSGICPRGVGLVFCFLIFKVFVGMVFREEFWILISNGLTFKSISIIPTLRSNISMSKDLLKVSKVTKSGTSMTLLSRGQMAYFKTYQNS